MRSTVPNCPSSEQCCFPEWTPGRRPVGYESKARRSGSTPRPLVLRVSRHRRSPRQTAAQKYSPAPARGALVLGGFAWLRRRAQKPVEFLAIAFLATAFSLLVQQTAPHAGPQEKPHLTETGCAE